IAGRARGPRFTQDRPPDVRDGRSDRRTPVGSTSQMPNAERTLPTPQHSYNRGPPGELLALPAADLADDRGEQLDAGHRRCATSRVFTAGEDPVVAPAAPIPRPARPPDSTSSVEMTFARKPGSR